jgi:hypothetical protein
MPENYSNLPIGLRVQSQIPLDAKQSIASEAALIDLGVNNNLAFVYEQGLVVYCNLESTRYEWREVLVGEELTGLRSSDFIYPQGVVANDVDYSNKKYNFFVVNGLTTDVQSKLDLKANKDSPTFTGVVDLPSTTTVDSTIPLSKVVIADVPFTRPNSVVRVDTTGRNSKESLVDITDLGSVNIPANQNYLIDGTAIQSDKTFRYSQTAPIATWNINHNLNKYPAVVITDLAGNEYESQFTYTDLNNITISFNNPFSGYANLN